MKQRDSLLLIFAATVGYGLMPIFTRIAYDAGLAPLELVLLRFGGAALLMLAFYAVTGSLGKLAIPFKTAARIVIHIGIPFAFTILAKFIAFKTMPMGVVQAIFYGYPIVVMVIAALRGSERLRATSVIGYLLIFCGILLTLDLSDVRITVTGIVLSTASMLMYGWYIFSIKHPVVLPVPSTIITTYTMSAGALITAILLPFFPGSGFQFAPTAWYGVTGLVLISSIGAFLAFNYGAKRVESGIAAIICCFETIVTVLFELAFLNGSYSARQYVGIVLIPLGITFSLIFTIIRNRRSEAASGRIGKGV